MDPLSQGIIGSTASQAFKKNKHSLLIVAIIGFLSGMAPDLDIFIRSSEDPLLFLEFHRQFTHSLIFIPVGGLICASFLYLILRKTSSITFKDTWLYSTIGYGTHGLLDACTSYGTLLFWPFSYERISWNNVSIIDPFFTIPLVFFVGLSIYFKKRVYARISLVWAISYLLIGIALNHVAMDVGKEIAIERGHNITRMVAKPTFANLFLWKIIYESGGKFYTDGVRIFPSKKIYYGESIAKLNINNDFNMLKISSQQYKDIKRFAWFSNDYLAVHPTNKNIIIDIRYSMLPNEINGLWGIEINPNANDYVHVSYITNRSLSERKFKDLFNMIIKN